MVGDEGPLNSLAAPLRHREHRYYGRTLSVCTECGKVIGAKVVERDGKAYLNKWCPEHGESLALVSASFEMYARPAVPLAGGRMPLEFATSVKRGCPEDCGYCPQHEQHACLGLIEITDRCDLACPICFSGSGGNTDITLDDFQQRLDTLERAEGRIDVVQLSGGEPTLHPALFALLDECRRRNPNRILLNTNGQRIARDPDFVAGLAAFKDILDVYLQYDGPSEAGIAALRGEDLRASREQALDRLAQSGLKTILVAAVQRDNLSSMPALLEVAVRRDGVTGVAFQAVAFCGRNARGDSAKRVTSPEIIAALCGTHGLRPSDFFPLPCSHPYCTQLCYLHCRPGKRPFPLIRLSNPQEIEQVIKNRFSFNCCTLSELAAKASWALFPSKLSFRNLPKAWALRRFFQHAEGSEWRGEKLLRVVVKQFMDAETFDAGRAARCCVGVVTADRRIIPFCSYNTIHRERGHESVV